MYVSRNQTVGPTTLKTEPQLFLVLALKTLKAFLNRVLIGVHTGYTYSHVMPFSHHSTLSQKNSKIHARLTVYKVL